MRKQLKQQQQNMIAATTIVGYYYKKRARVRDIIDFVYPPKNVCVALYQKQQL